MDNTVRFIGAVVVAVVAFFVIFGTLSEAFRGPGDASIGALDGPQMRGCLRSMVKEGASETEAQATCACMFREYEAMGVSLWDAAGDQRPAMTRVARDCAEDAGMALPAPVGSAYEDDGYAEDGGDFGDDWGD